MKYYIRTYGCQMNVHESEKIAGILEKRGYVSCDDVKDCDIAVFNTCAIRENAENRVYGNIGALKKIKASHPGMIVAVCGCMTQQQGVGEALLKRFPFVDIVFGADNLQDFESLLDRKASGEKRQILSVKPYGGVYEDCSVARTSYPNAWVNITYGCDNFCSYCIVPYVKGRERSRGFQDILSEAEKAVAEGYREITLLGQNVNSYRDGDRTFPDLLRAINALDGKFRLRFMTSHPKDFSAELVAAMRDCDKVCDSIHLPLQSGSDKILKAMNRKYTFSEYLEKVSLLKSEIPSCSVSTDLIVGFPGETDEDFLKTLDAVKTVGFDSAFMFVYSRREGTAAAKMDGQIRSDVSKERIMRLVDLVNAQTREKSEKYVGKTVEILCEDRDVSRGYMGRDEHGRMAYFFSDRDEIGNFLNVKISEANGISLKGEIIR